MIIGPQYVPLERLGPRAHLLPAQRRIGNWLGIEDVLCHPSDYESHCFSINEAWRAGAPVVSCDYLVNRQFEERHGPLMWLVPHAQGEAILSVLRSRRSPGGRLFVGAPAVWMDQGAAHRNEFERQRSLWTTDDLLAFGFELLDDDTTDRLGNQMLLGVAAN